MFAWMAKRLVNYALMLFIATSLGYFLASSFLKPRANFLAQTPPPPKSSIDQFLDYANVNDEELIFVRYWRWLKSVVLHWDWGYSPVGEPVTEEIWQRAEVSVQLVFVGTLLAIVIGVGLGVLTAIRKYGVLDRILTNGLTTLLFVVPTFVMATLVVLVYLYLHKEFGVDGLFVTGLGNAGDGFFEYVRHLVLPTLALTLVGYAGYHLTQRLYLLDTINAPYVRAARARGLPRRKAIVRHALRTAFIPTSYGIAFSISRMVTGVVFIELIFSIHGAGWYFLETIGNNDINGAVALIFLGGASTCVALWLADIFVAFADPRIRTS